MPPLVHNIPECLPDALVIVNERGRILFVNHQTEKLFGYTRQELLGMSVDSLMPERYRKEQVKNRAGYFVQAQTRPMGGGPDLYGRRKDGSEFPVDISFNPMQVEGGLLVVSVIRDITRYKQIEKTLRESEQRMRLVLDSTVEGIGGLNSQGICTFCNAACLRILGYKEPGEIVGKNLHDLIHHTRPDGTPYPESECRFLEAAKKGEPIHLTDELFWRADGTSFHAESFALPLHEKGELLGSVVTFLDITERLQVTGLLYQAQKMEAIGHLAGGIAHDFNNLLGVILGYSELLQSHGNLDDRLRGQVDEIFKAANRGASLTRQLLAFSRQQMLESEVLNVNDVATNMATMLRRLIGEDITLSTSLDPNLGSVKAGRGQIEQVIMNLAMNARDAMPKGGKLVIETSNAEMGPEYAAQHPPFIPGKYILLSITDIGIGMDQKTKDRIFEPFFTSKPRGHGTGLGLATVYGIVKQSGGFIWVYSEPGHGSIFKIYLPRTIEPAAAKHPGAEQERLLPGTETILLVEDDESIRTLTRTLLEQAGYNVLETDDCAHALDVARRHSGVIHLILTDVIMPGMSGPDLVKNLAPLHPATGVLYISGYAGDSHKGLLDEGVSLLQKPFSRDALLRKVREILDQNN